MQLSGITKDIRQMSDEELLEHVRGIRHNKYVARPAAAKRRADERKKTVRKTTGKIDKIVAKLSPEARAALIAELMKG